ncbi:uncharacterized, partial [Tachysurus ichikawai]
MFSVNVIVTPSRWESVRLHHEESDAVTLHTTIILFQFKRKRDRSSESDLEQNDEDDVLISSLKSLHNNVLQTWSHDLHEYN